MQPPSWSTRRHAEHHDARHFIDEVIDVGSYARRLAVEGEHNETVQRRPDGDRHLPRISLAHESGALQLTDSFGDETEYSAPRLAQRGKVIGDGDLRAEHHAILGRVGEPELHVRDRDHLQSAATLRPLHLLQHGLLQALEAALGDRGDERAPIGEMAVWRGLAYSGATRDRAQREGLEALVAEEREGTLYEGFPQITMVVRPALPRRSRSSGH
jgi:hypothetical protein